MKFKSIVIGLVLLVLPAIVLAQTPPATTPSGCTQLTTCVSQIYTWSIGAAAVLAVLMIVVGGYITLTAGGNAERASKGRNYIWSSIIGLVLLVGAYILLHTINPDLVNFSNNCVNNVSKCGQTQSQTTNTLPHQ